MIGDFHPKYEWKYSCGHSVKVEAGGSPPVECSQCEDGVLYPPRWAGFRHNYSHKPDFADVVPKELYELGEVFFPIPRGKKGWSYPHHMDEYRYAAYDEVFNAYLEAGWGYGIAMDGDLAVIDVDDPAFFARIYSQLPDTMWQTTGSGVGKHIFYLVDGLDTRITLHHNEIYDALDWAKDASWMLEDVADLTKQAFMFKDHWYHIGEVKCDPHGYVVGPGSVHPSGNTYGPLYGDEIATVDKVELYEVLEPFIKPDVDEANYKKAQEEELSSGSKARHNLYHLTADDVLPELAEGSRVGHPVAAHGSDTGMNFMKNDGGETFTCWHCQYGMSDGCGLDGAQYLAVKATNMDCDDVRRYWSSDPVLHYKAWLQGVKDGLLDYLAPPYSAVEGYGVDIGAMERREKLGGGRYRMLRQMLEWEAISEVRSDWA